jgi:hypothetical protein
VTLGILKAMVRVRRRRVSFWAEVPSSRRKKVTFKTKAGAKTKKKRVSFLARATTKKRISFYARRE